MTHFAAVSVAFMVSSSVVLVEGNVTCYILEQLLLLLVQKREMLELDPSFGALLLGEKGGGRKSGTSSKYSRKLHYNARHFR